MQPGYYRDLGNEDYHGGEGVSKSQLDLLHKSPALLPWSRNAPEDEEKKTALNVGDAVHAILLEPHRFDAEYAVGPKDAPRNTKAGKEVWAAFEEELNGRTVLTHEEHRKIQLMRESVMAHPHARWLIEAEGDAEASIYWNEQETGELARCRPDKNINAHGWVMDLKTTADMSRFSKSVYEYRYHVQDAMYSDGYAAHYGEQPAGFVFLVVSTSIECARYPVRLFTLDAEAKQIGRAEYQADMATFHECKAANEWPGIETLSLPVWARKQS